MGTPVGGVRRGKRGAIRGGRGRQTWGGSGPRVGVRGSSSGPWGVMAVPREPEAVRVAPRGGGGMMALWGVGEPGAGVSCGRGGAAVPFVGVCPSAGPAGQLEGRLRCQGGIVRCCQVLGGGDKASRPPWMRRVGGLRPVRWMRCRGWQVVRVQWLLRGVSRVGVALGGLGSFGVGVVAGRIRFLVGRGGPWW